MDAKTQSALEYLMTYGWAILILVIVGAALFALGVFNPQASSTMTMTGISNFQLIDAVITADGNLTLVLGTKTGSTTTVSNIDFIVEGTSCSNSADTADVVITTSSNQQMTILPGTACSLTSGDKVTLDPITISYTVAGSSLNKTETGSISGLSVQ